MSSANVLQEATAPPEEIVAECQYTPLYPHLSSDPQTFRLGEISCINKKIADEAGHYQLVLKKYKKAQKALNFTVASLGVFTTAMSSRAVASALTGVGIVISVPLGVVGAVCGAVSTGLVAVNKKVGNKVKKHFRTSLLENVEHNTINSLVPKALDNNNISDTKFKIITHEMEKYRKIKDALQHQKGPQPTLPISKKLGKRSVKKCGKKSLQPAQL